MTEHRNVPWWRSAGSPWVLLLAAPIIGTLYFLALYLVAEASCSQDVGLLDPPVLRTLIIVTGGVSLVALAGYARRAVRTLRTGDDGSPAGDDAGRENRRFMLFVGLLLLAMFAVFVVFLVTPTFGGPVC